MKIIFCISHVKYSGRDYTNWTYKREGLTTERRISETVLYSFLNLATTLLCRDVPVSASVSVFQESRISGRKSE